MKILDRKASGGGPFGQATSPVTEDVSSFIFSGGRFSIKRYFVSPFKRFFLSIRKILLPVRTAMKSVQRRPRAFVCLFVVRLFGEALVYVFPWKVTYYLLIKLKLLESGKKTITSNIAGFKPPTR